MADFTLFFFMLTTEPFVYRSFAELGFIVMYLLLPSMFALTVSRVD